MVHDTSTLVSLATGNRMGIQTELGNVPCAQNTGSQLYLQI